MDVEDTPFTLLNVGPDFDCPEDMSDYFSLKAPPNTHIWRKPSQCDDTTAPMVLKRLHQSFILAEVTVTVEFEMEFDQAGLVIFAGSPPGQVPRTPVLRRDRRYSNRTQSQATATGKWVKAGLEFTNGACTATSVVATSACGSDWSCSSSLSISRDHPPGSWAFPSRFVTASLKIKFERVDDSLWVWFQWPEDTQRAQSMGPSHYPYSTNSRSPAEVGADWTKMREVMGFFSGREEKGNVWIGCYASRPMDFEPDNSWDDVDSLFAEFEDLEIL